MRKGFEGLHGLVRDRLSCEPRSGHSSNSGSAHKALGRTFNGTFGTMCVRRCDVLAATATERLRSRRMRGRWKGR